MELGVKQYKGRVQLQFHSLNNGMRGPQKITQAYWVDGR
jgi:hypothetical protein